jgi:hypothetical protein
MPKAKKITVNRYYLYGVLALSLSTVTAGIFWNSLFGYLFYILLFTSIFMTIKGSINKKNRVNAEQADQLLIVSSLLLLLANVLVLVSQSLPASNQYHLEYVNYWQGWPVLPLAIALTVVLLSVKRQAHKKYVYVAIILFVIGLFRDLIISSLF